MADLAGDGLDGLHAGRAGADHGDAFACEVNRLMRPARGVEGCVRAKLSRPSMRGRVGVESGPIAVIRKRARKRLAIFERDGPASRRLLVDRGA